MRARVVDVNLRRGFIAVATSGGITVMEFLGGYEVEMEDVISGDLESLGGEVVVNETRGEKMEVYIQDVDCTAEHAKELMK